MPQAKDFRDFAFSRQRIENCAKHLGRYIYWKLFIIENSLRIMINSILSVQYYEKGGEWWDDLAGGKAKKNAAKNKNRYLVAEAKFFGMPGKHPIYFVDMKDLGQIIRENYVLFSDVIGYKNYNKLLVEIESIIIPRNIVAHMNYPTKTDMNRIDTLSQDIYVYLDFIIEKDIELKIP